jgi:hypothetical protein
VAGLLRQRDTETTGRTDLVMKEVRTRADAAYRSLVEQVDEVYYDIVARVEALDLIEGETAGAPWAAFIASLNTVIDYTANIVAQRKGRAKTGKEEEPAAEDTV